MSERDLNNSIEPFVPDSLCGDMKFGFEDRTEYPGSVIADKRRFVSDATALEILESLKVSCRPELSRYGYRFVKRAFDLFLSGLALVVLFIPSLLLCALIYFKSPGADPLYCQRRVKRLGKDGSVKTFYMWKFRSMVPHAEDMLESLQKDNEADGPLFKIKEDPRIIPGIGNFMRVHSIDELPQIINVFLGDIPLRILKTRPEFSEKSMGAFALPAKSSTNKEEAFSQVVSCFASGLRMRRISGFNYKRVGSMGGQFLAKLVFKAVRAEWPVISRPFASPRRRGPTFGIHRQAKPGERRGTTVPWSAKL